MHRTRFIELILIASACASPVRADFENICNASELSGATRERDACARGDVLGSWLSSRIKTDEARAFLLSVQSGSREDAERLKAIVDEAARRGVTPCNIVITDWVDCL